METTFSFRFNTIVFVLVIAMVSGTCNSRDTAGFATQKWNAQEEGIDSVFSFLNLDYPGMEDVKAAYDKGDIEKAKMAYLEFRRKKSKVRWFINPNDKPHKPVSSTYPAADNIMHHIIPPSAGAPQAFIGKDINWKYNPVDPSEPYFTKEWTWCNLNRMPFWNTLGKAYWNTLDEKYAREWVYQMTDWVKDNPVPLNAGPGATLCWRTIEAGIRMAGSWMNAYYYFLFSPSFTPDANLTFVKGVIEHGRRLEKVTLDYPEHGGNWVTMECNGLGTVGILFPELKEAKEFRKVAFERLNKELNRQVYPDGAQFELSTGYHQVSRRNFMALAQLAQLNNISLPEGYLDKLKKMYVFNLYMMDPTGVLPPFNDASPVNVTSSLMEAYHIWKDKEFLFGATLGKKGEKPTYDSYFFPYAGYYVMRSGWNVSDNCLYFDAGPVGEAHVHEDKLNLYLYSRGKILLTEPGTYSYDKSKWRKYVLSTSAHNTIIVDGKEQHRYDIPACRVIKEPLKNPWVSSPLFDYVMGIYSSGYQESRYRPVQYYPVMYVGKRDSSIQHIRHVVFLKPYYYMVVDFLVGKGKHRYESHFNLNAPNAEIDNKTKDIYTMRPDDIQLGLFPMNIKNLKVEIVKGQKNPVLGWIPREKRPIPTVVFTKEETAPCTFSTLLFPYFKNKPEVKYKRIMKDRDDLWGRNISTPYETVSLMIRKSEGKMNMPVVPEVTPPFYADAKVILIRKPKDKKESYFGFYDLSSYKDDHISFDLASPSSLIMVNEKNGVLLYNPKNEETGIHFSIPLDKTIILPVKKWVEINSSGAKELKKEISLFKKTQK